MELFYDKEMVKVTIENKLTWIINRLGGRTYQKTEDVVERTRELEKRYDFLMNFDNLSKCSPAYLDERDDVSIDLTEPLSKINHAPVEELLVIAIDKEEQKILDYKIVSRGTEKTVGGPESNLAVIDYLKQYSGIWNGPSFVFVHNHPGAVVAEPSENDKKYNEALKTMCHFIGVYYADSMIVTDYDCWSEKQKEKTTK